MDLIISSISKSFQLILALDPYLVEVSLLSLFLSLSSAVASFAIGVPLGFMLSEGEFPGKKMVIAVVNTGMGLPPVIVGLIVSLLFGRAGIFGALNILYSCKAIFISQLIIAFPMACGLTIAACGEIPVQLKMQLKSFGAGRLQCIYYLSREIRKTLPAIFLAAFGSVVSEVGAVIMVGGNILGETRVLTTAIVSEVRMGNYEIALAFSFVLLAVTFMVNYIVGSITGKKRV